MKNTLYLLLGLTAALLLSSCSSVNMFGEPSSWYGNLFRGMWDGALWFFIWIWSLFNPDTHVYNGAYSNWYLWGFVMMLAGMAKSSVTDK